MDGCFEVEEEAKAAAQQRGRERRLLVESSVELEIASQRPEEDSRPLDLHQGAWVSYGKGRRSWGWIQIAVLGICDCDEYKRPGLVPLKSTLCKKKFRHIKFAIHAWSTKYDKIKNKFYSLVVLCETNVLSLISQRLDNYYQIQTKCYSVATVNVVTPNFGTKHSQSRKMRLLVTICRENFSFDT
jgi:hypothetical protein